MLNIVKAPTVATITHQSNKPLHILIVEDDVEVSSTLQQGFEALGFKVKVASTSQEMFQAIKTNSIDLITLDLTLKGDNVDGLDLATQIRALRNIPIIIITGRDQPVDRLAGLEKGADDYITKPFMIGEAAIRVRTVAERYGLLKDKSSLKEEDNRSLYAFSDFSLDPIHKEVRTSIGTYVPLTETECNLLEMFLKSPQRVISRDEMMHQLRGSEWQPLDRGLDGHVARLRGKIENKADDAPRLIKSVRGVGYVFVGEVTRIDPDKVSKGSLRVATSPTSKPF